MIPLAAQPVEPMDDGSKNRSRQDALLKPTDSKIQDFIMPRISLPGLKEGSLLATATAPQIVLNHDQNSQNPMVHGMIPMAHSNQSKEKARLSRDQRSALSDSDPDHYFPVGLACCAPHHWINALMQFLLFIPLLREVFAYTPPSFHPFNRFIDQYLKDQQEKRPICRANCQDLAFCLLGKFPQFFQKGALINLHEVITSISRSAGALTPYVDTGFRSDWHVFWDSSQEFCLQEIFEKKSLASELLVVLQSLYDPVMRKNPHAFISQALRKQYLSSASVCYDLDAFIEYRMEEGEEVCYYTYLKVNGTWVQCCDERVVFLRRSTLLDLPLRRGLLFHYRRVWGYTEHA